MPAGTKSVRVPVEFRKRRYPFRKEVNYVLFDHKDKYTDDSGGEGYEIVCEVTACPECAAQSKHPPTV
jgi:hypothetical protein